MDWIQGIGVIFMAIDIAKFAKNKWIAPGREVIIIPRNENASKYINKAIASGKSAEVCLSKAPKWVLIFLKEHTLLAVGITLLFLSFLIP